MRIVVAFLGGTLALLLLSGAIPTLLLITFMVVGLLEYSRLVDISTPYARMLLALGIIAAPLALLSLDAFLFLPPVLLIMAMLQPILLNRQEDVRHMASRLQRSARPHRQPHHRHSTGLLCPVIGGVNRLPRGIPRAGAPRAPRARPPLRPAPVPCVSLGDLGT